MGISLIVSTYSKRKRQYVSQGVNKIINQRFSKYENAVSPLKGDLSIILEGKYKNPTTIKLPLDKQENFLANQIETLDNIGVDKLRKTTIYLDPIMEYYYNAIIDKATKFGMSNDFIKYYDRHLKKFTDYYREIYNEQRAKLNGVQLGKIGEDRMEKELKSFEKVQGFKTLSNVQLQFGNKSFETDFLVFSKHGIFSIEVKNIGEHANYSIQINPDGQWLKVFDNDNKVPMQDISSQVNYHMSMTDGLFGQYIEETGNQVPEVKPIIIIANNNVVVNNLTNLPIYRVSQFIHIMRNEPVIMNDTEIEQLYNWISQFQVPTKSYEVLDYTECIKQGYQVFEEISVHLNVIDELVNDLAFNTDDYFKKEIKKSIKH